MSDNPQPDADLAIAHVLFIDIVAYSELAIDQQREVVEQLPNGAVRHVLSTVALIFRCMAYVPERFCHPRFTFMVSCTGLAVADLVSRLVLCAHVNHCRG